VSDFTVKHLFLTKVTDQLMKIVVGMC